MANVVVVGAQWGDEGKGKIVDWLSERADIIDNRGKYYFKRIYYFFNEALREQFFF